jgi:hypothetical protein
MCQCQDSMEETGRLGETAIQSITTIASSGGSLRVRVTCIHEDSWEALLFPGDPLYRFLAEVKREMYIAA